MIVRGETTIKGKEYVDFEVRILKDTYEAILRAVSFDAESSMDSWCDAYLECAALDAEDDYLNSLRSSVRAEVVAELKAELPDPAPADIAVTLKKKRTF